VPAQGDKAEGNRGWALFSNAERQCQGEGTPEEEKVANRRVCLPSVILTTTDERLAEKNAKRNNGVTRGVRLGIRREKGNLMGCLADAVEYNTKKAAKDGSITPPAGGPRIRYQMPKVTTENYGAKREDNYFSGGSKETGKVKAKRLAEISTPCAEGKSKL